MRIRTRRRTEREGESSAWVQIRFRCAEFGKNLAGLSRQFAASANRRFEFHKRSQLFIRTHKWAASRSFVFSEQLQHEWDRRYRADGNQRPADCSPLLSRQLFRKQQRDASAEHCTRAGDETDLRNGNFVLFHVSFHSFYCNSNPSQSHPRVADS